jgi:hypothetical protein
VGLLLHFIAHAVATHVSATNRTRAFVPTIKTGLELELKAKSLLKFPFSIYLFPARLA